MTWRPKEGWDTQTIADEAVIQNINLLQKNPSSGFIETNEFTNALIEAGADAMLEALKAQPNTVSVRYGRWVYIADEEAKGGSERS